MPSLPLSPSDSPPRARSGLLDGLRGVAIIAMVIFHFAWDLYFLGFWSVDVSTDPFWTALQKAIVSSFLGLAGVSLWLAHGRGVRWPKFWRREAVLVAAALAVSAGTYLAFGDYFAYFGVLHAIALFSLLALPFLRLPASATAGIGVLIIVLPLLVSHPVMRERWLSWIGFWPISPSTADIVPMFPWLGVLLIGVAVGRWSDGFPIWRLAVPGWLSTMGRWSLVIYLVHQPVLYGALLGLSMLMPQVDEARRAEDFVQNCRATRALTEPDPLVVERYCGCALEQVAEGEMWEMLTRERSAAEELELQGMINLCDAMSREPIAEVPAPTPD